MMTFADFQPVSLLGESDFEFTDETMGEWSALFPDDRASLPKMPPAMIAMVFMRAYVKIVNERPPGNVHAGQKFWVSRLPKLGDRLTTRLSCTGKEIKSNRRWVTFDANTVDAAGQLLFRGQMKTIWAA
jgi:hypothetical protein